MENKAEKSIRILIAEDHEIVRCGLKTILDQQHDLEVIGEASSCKEILTLTSSLSPDVTLLNLTLSDGGSLDSIVKFRDLCPNCKVLIYTASTDTEIQLLAIRYGAVGILLKSQTAELVCKAIRNVHLNDELWIDKTLTTQMWKQHMQSTIESETKASSSSSSSTTDKSSSSASTCPQHRLTPRENQIACFSSKGLTAKLIGEKLFISEKTVRNQLTIIYSKLNVKNQLELTINCSNCNFLDICTK